MDAVFVATLLGSAVGVVAGTVVQYFTQILINARQAAARRKNLAKEFTHNLAVVVRVKEDLTRIREPEKPGVISPYCHSEMRCTLS
jgi:hypothetical protein